MATLPASIPLGRIDGLPNKVDTRFSGRDISSASQLPEHLFGCRLDPSSFRFEKEQSLLKSLFGEPKQSWSCRWTGGRDDTFVELGWETGLGWKINVKWYGESLIFGMGYAAVPFCTLFEHTMIGFSDGVEKNPARLPVSVLKTPAKVPKTASLPDGVIMTAVLPLRADLVPEAVERWNAFRTERGNLICGASAAVILHQAIKLTHDGRTAVELAKENMTETGILCPDLPIVRDNGEAQVFRYVYALHITTAYYELPAVIDRFLPLLERNPRGIGRGFVCSAALLPAFTTVREGTSDFIIVWQRLPDPVAALAAEPSYPAKVDKALNELREAIEYSRNVYSAMFEDGDHPDADDVVLVEETRNEEDVFPDGDDENADESDGAPPSPYGVPLDDVAETFRITDGCSARYDGNRLIVRGENEKTDTVIEVVPPQKGVSPDIAALIRVTTVLPETKDKTSPSAEAQSMLNTHAAGGSLITLKDGRQAVVSRINWYKKDNAWKDVQRMLVSIAAFQGATPQMLGAAVQLGAAKPQFTGSSAWKARDFRALESMMSGRMFCNASDTGFTGEVVLEGGGASMMDGSLTALIQMTADSHPYLGPGLLCRLSMPNAFASANRCAETAADLNRLEADGFDEAYHFGAWCSNDGKTLSYVTFFPNHTKANNSLTMNWPFVLSARAKWAHAVLKRSDDQTV